MEPRTQELGVSAPEMIAFFKLAFAKAQDAWNNLKARYSDAELKAALERPRSKRQFVLRPFPSTKWLS